MMSVNNIRDSHFGYMGHDNYSALQSGDKVRTIITIVLILFLDFISKL